MTGTGFIGYLGVGKEYFNVLMTNNHVIKTLEDAMCSRLKFENAFGQGQHCTVKLYDVIAVGVNNFWTNSENEVCVCVCVCVCACVHVCVCVCVCVTCTRVHTQHKVTVVNYFPLCKVMINRIYNA